MALVNRLSVRGANFHEFPGRADANKFLQRMAIGRDQAAVAAGRQRDFADVEVAERSTQMSCGAKKSPAAHGLSPPPQRACNSPRRIEDAHASAGRGCPAAARCRGTCRRDSPTRRRIRCRRVDRHLAGPGHVGPLGEKLAVGREELQAAVLAIGDIHRPGAIDRDAVRHVKLPGPAPGSPHERSSRPSARKAWTRALP